MSAPAIHWPRLLLFAGLLVLGLAYVDSFLFFRVHSRDFVATGAVVNATEAAMHRPLAVGDVLRFGIDQPGTAQLGAGWHRPDGEGVWTGRDESWLVLVLDAAPAASLALSLDARVAVGKRPVTVRLFAGDIEIGHWQATAADDALPGRVQLPAGGSPDRPLVLRFVVDDPHSPWRERTGEDTRRIGVLLRSLRIETASD